MVPQSSLWGFREGDLIQNYYKLGNFWPFKLSPIHPHLHQPHRRLLPTCLSLPPPLLNMPEIPAPGRGGLGAGRGRGGWSLVRQFVNQKISDEKEKGGGPARRDSGSRSSLASALLNNFRLSQRRPSQGENDLPEEGGDLHRFFATCASLTRLREELRNAINEDAESNTLLNACARPEGDTGRLLLHSIGLNASLITSGGGGTAAAQSRVNQFVLEEILPVSESLERSINFYYLCARSHFQSPNPKRHILQRLSR